MQACPNLLLVATGRQHVSRVAASDSVPMDKHTSSLPGSIASKTPMSTTVAATDLRKKYRRLRKQSHSPESFSRSSFAFASCALCSIDGEIDSKVCIRALSADHASTRDQPEALINLLIVINSTYSTLSTMPSTLVACTLAASRLDKPLTQPHGAGQGTCRRTDCGLSAQQV